MGYTELHYLFSDEKEKVSLEQVQRTVQDGLSFSGDGIPPILKEKDDDGQLPLHVACKYGVSFDVVQYLVDRYPESVHEKDSGGRLPLRVSCGHNGEHSLEVIKYLARRYPESVKEKDGDGGLPLELCFNITGRVDVMKYLALQYPDGVRIAELPQWVSSPEDAPSEVFDYVVKKYGTYNKYESYEHEPPKYVPMARALECRAPLSAIKYWVQRDPESAWQRYMGKLPLHSAMVYHAPLDVCKYLVEIYPQGVKKKVKSALLPLQNQHRAYRNLVSADKSGTLPLHTACESRNSMDVIKYLVEQYPTSVKEIDEQGNLPLHWACRSMASFDVVKYLVVQYPEGLHQDNDDSKTPYELVNEDSTMFSHLVKIFHEMEASERNQMLHGDHATGDDLLGVKEVADALGDNLAFKDLEPPFVVAISGGWGTGKTFTFNLIENRLKWIQKLPVNDPKSFPYAGHIYLVTFSAWTYAKGDLWSSLMYRILSDLNDQLYLESKIDPKYLIQGVSIIEIVENLTKGEYKYLAEKLENPNDLSELKKWSLQSGNVTSALINAVGNGYKADVANLKKLKDEEHQLAVDLMKEQHKRILKAVAEEARRKHGEVFAGLLEEALNLSGYWEENEANSDLAELKQFFDNEEVSQLIKDGISSLRWWRIAWPENARETWVVIIMMAVLIAFAVLANFYFDSIISVLSVVVPITVAIAGIAMRMWKFYENIKPLARKYEEARKENMFLESDEWSLSVEANFDVEAQINEDGQEQAALLNDDADKNRVEFIKKQARLAGVKRDISSIQRQLHLVEGESLADVVINRVKAGDYEKPLGVVHKAQTDLQRLSDAMMMIRSHDENDANSTEKKKPFPRDNPRIVLFVDDLDRCPPPIVVEMLEAVQLLVKTNLFVVVLALDSRYVTLSLEKNYKGILRHDGTPCGMDYLEKIVQLPFRIPPPDENVMREYIRVQMGSGGQPSTSRQSSPQGNSFVGAAGGLPNFNGEKGAMGTDKSKDNVVVETPKKPEPWNDELTDATPGKGLRLKKKTRRERRLGYALPTTKLITDETEFDRELDTLTKACVAADVTPRATKRLVNVLKLMKIVWYKRRRKEGAEDKPLDDKSESVRLACLVFLALSTSRLPGMRAGMQEVLSTIETEIKNIQNPATIEANREGESENQVACEKTVAELVKPILMRRCAHSYNSCQSIVMRELAKVTPSDLAQDIRLVRSFSFLGEDWNVQGSDTSGS